jgi:hypothetical protein
MKRKSKPPKKAITRTKKKQATRGPLNEGVPVELLCDDRTLTALRECAELADTTLDTVVAVLLALRILRDKELVGQFAEGL